MNTFFSFSILDLIRFTTNIAVAGYGMLALVAYRHHGHVDFPNRHVLFVAMLFVVGFVMVHQVQRMRSLSQYYGQDL